MTETTNLFNGNLVLSCEPYSLELRSAFGTSHSSTTVRTNALITISVSDGSGRETCTEVDGTGSGRDALWHGYGEVGLPPKKKGCYLANYEDVAHFFQIFCDHVNRELSQYDSLDQQISVSSLYDPFETLRNQSSDVAYFELLRADSASATLTVFEALPYLLFKVLDTCQYLDENEQPLEYRLAAQCGVEMAILDLWCKLNKQSLHQAIGLSYPKDKFAFYTVGLNEDEQEYRKSVEFGLKYSKHLKLKLDGDVPKSIKLCKIVHDIYTTTNLPVCQWSVDANAAWTPELTIQFLEELEKHPTIKQYMYMIEQPFPVDCLSQVVADSDLRSKWIRVKHEAGKQGILIFADESVSTYKNIDLIKEFVHGVNFKLEKAGGVRGVLHGAAVAMQHDLKIWLGCMVSSRLSCTCSAHLLSLSAIGGDLDGDLLVKEESQGFDGGFQWGTDSTDQWGVVILDSQADGIGLIRKSSQ